MTSCPICNHVNPARAARCEKCNSWLAQAADIGLKPQARVEHPGEHAGGSPPPLTPEFAAELQGLLRDGKKITAIARFREVTGLGLRESKDAVEALEAGRTMSALAADGQVADAKVVTLLRENQFIPAIKEYRAATGLGLKEAKEAVEAIARKHGIDPKQPGCFGMLVLLSTLIPVAVGSLVALTAMIR